MTHSEHLLVISFSAGLAKDRHFDGSNQLYADGHVKWIKGDLLQANSNYLFLKIKP